MGNRPLSTSVSNSTTIVVVVAVVVVIVVVFVIIDYVASVDGVTDGMVCIIFFSLVVVEDVMAGIIADHGILSVRVTAMTNNHHVMRCGRMGF